MAASLAKVVGLMKVAGEAFRAKTAAELRMREAEEALAVSRHEYDTVKGSLAHQKKFAETIESPYMKLFAQAKNEENAAHANSMRMQEAFDKENGAFNAAMIKRKRDAGAHGTEEELYRMKAEECANYGVQEDTVKSRLDKLSFGLKDVKLQLIAMKDSKQDQTTKDSKSNSKQEESLETKQVSFENRIRNVNSTLAEVKKDKRVACDTKRAASKKLKKSKDAQPIGKKKSQKDSSLVLAQKRVKISKHREGKAKDKSDKARLTLSNESLRNRQQRAELKQKQGIAESKIENNVEMLKQRSQDAFRISAEYQVATSKWVAAKRVAEKKAGASSDAERRLGSVEASVPGKAASYGRSLHRSLDDLEMVAIKSLLYESMLSRREQEARLILSRAYATNAKKGHVDAAEATLAGLTKSVKAAMTEASKARAAYNNQLRLITTKFGKLLSDSKRIAKLAAERLKNRSGILVAVTERVSAARSRRAKLPKQVKDYGLEMAKARRSLLSLNAQVAASREVLEESNEKVTTS